MRKVLRLVALSVFLVTSVLIVALNSSFWSSYTQGRPSLVGTALERERLNRLQADANRRLDDQVRIAVEVIIGHLSLIEAMELYNEMDQGWVHPGFKAWILAARRESEVDWIGRRVIGWVRRILQDVPDQLVIVSCLEAELQGLSADRSKTDQTLTKEQP